MLTKLFPELTNEDYFEQTNNYRINVYERTELGTYFTLYTDVNSLNKTVFVNFIDATQEKVLVNIEYIVQKDNETLRYTVKSRVSDECSLRSQDPDKPVYSSIIFTIKNNKKIIKSFVRNNEMYEFYFDRKEEFKWEDSKLIFDYFYFTKVNRNRNKYNGINYGYKTKLISHLTYGLNLPEPTEMNQHREFIFANVRYNSSSKTFRVIWNTNEYLIFQITNLEKIEIFSKIIRKHHYTFNDYNTFKISKIINFPIPMILNKYKILYDKFTSLKTPIFETHLVSMILKYR
jgi:hypothetical protein